MPGSPGQGERSHPQGRSSSSRLMADWPGQGPSALLDVRTDKARTGVQPRSSGGPTMARIVARFACKTSSSSNSNISTARVVFRSMRSRGPRFDASRRLDFAPQRVGGIVRGGQQWNRSALAFVGRSSAIDSREERQPPIGLALRRRARGPFLVVVPLPVRASGNAAMVSSRPSPQFLGPPRITAQRGVDRVDPAAVLQALRDLIGNDLVLMKVLQHPGVFINTILKCLSSSTLRAHGEGQHRSHDVAVVRLLSDVAPVVVIREASIGVGALLE